MFFDINDIDNSVSLCYNNTAKCCNVYFVVVLTYYVIEIRAEVCMNHEKERSGNKMAALATPKRNSYVVKKNCVSQIVNSKISQSKQSMIKSNAELFRKNNLKTEK